MSTSVAVAYAQINPLVETLLQSIQKVKAESTLEDERLQCLQTQAKLFAQLNTFLSGFPDPSRLNILMELISYPLLAVLQVYSTRALDRRAQVRRSRIFSVKTAAVQTIQTLLSLEHITTSTVPNTIPSLPPVPLKFQEKFLVALIETLPTAPEVAAGNFSNAGGSLDDGSSLYLQVLKTIQEYFKKSSTTTLSLEFFPLARLIDSCTACLELPKLVVTASETLAQCLDRMTSTLVIGIESSVIWKRMFPGIFLGLYKCLLSTQQQNNKDSGRVDVQCLVALRLLFQSTLPRQSTKPTAQNMMAKLQQLCLKDVHDESVTSSSEKSKSASNSMQTATAQDRDEDAFFLEQLNQRTVGLLTVLITQCRASKHEHVRLETAHLCQLLLERPHCWSYDLAESIPKLALESSLLLQQDKDDNVATFANNIFKGISSKETDWMVPNLLSHIKSLPDIMQGRRDVEVQSRLSLIMGYVKVCPPTALLHHRHDILPSLVTCMDIDIENVSLETPAIRIVGAAPFLPYRYIASSESRGMGQQMLRTMGEVLGMKRTAILVDHCVATVYESTLKVSEQAKQGDMGHNGKEHADWAHGVIGYLVVAVEILRGASMRKETDSEKDKKRRTKYLHSLASSVIPIATSSCLWDLSTSNEVVSSNESRKVSLALLARLGRSNFVSRKANASILCLLLQLIAVFADRLGCDMKSFLSITLVPCVEMATDVSAPLVRATADHTLQRIAHSIRSDENQNNHDIIQQMIRDNVQSLLSTFLTRLRIHRGKIAPSPDEYERILSTSSMTKYVLQAISQSPSCAEKSHSPCVESIRSVRELISILVDRFDHLLHKKVVAETRRLEFAQVLSTCLQYLCKEYGVEKTEIYTYRLPGTVTPVKQPWREVLDQFIIPNQQGFIADKNDANGQESTGGQPKLKKISADSEDVDFVDSMLSRCCYLLSNDSLRVRIAACDGMISGFHYLSFLACQEEELSEEGESPVRTAILRQVGVSWPSIQARLSATSEDIILSQQAGSAVVVRTGPNPSETKDVSPDLGTRRVFLSKLFVLIATISEGSGEFIASRFRKDVWPTMAEHFGQILGKQARKQNLLEGKSGGKNGKYISSSANSSQPFLDSEQNMMVSMMNTLSRIYNTEETGARLSDLIPMIGNVLLPLLDDSVGDKYLRTATMNALKSMSCVNSDALYRPLLHLSGRGLPLCPLQIIGCNNTEGALLSLAIFPKSDDDDAPTSSLASRAGELLDYIEGLPEQVIY